MKTNMKELRQDRIFYFINSLILILLTIIALYPLYFVVIASFSDPVLVGNGDVLIIPRGVTLETYQKIFEYEKIWIGYANTLFYTSFGTVLDVTVTLLAAYSLSRTDLYGKKFFTWIFTFTMFFGGGLIPTYLQVKALHLLNTRWVLVILGAVSVWNLIVARTFFQSTIPGDLLEAAQIDGCGNGRFFFRIVLPLSKAIIAVMVVYYAVGHWNSFFNALVYVTNRKLIPLQLVLREILTSSQQLMQQMELGIMNEDIVANTMLAESIKYGIIVVSSAPIMCVYPFAQKYFVKGVMIGSLKG